MCAVLFSINGEQKHGWKSLVPCCDIAFSQGLTNDNWIYCDPIPIGEISEISFPHQIKGLTFLEGMHIAHNFICQIFKMKLFYAEKVAW